MSTCKDAPTVYVGKVPVFAGVKADKAQVLKIAEECCEVYSAWEDYEKVGRFAQEADALLAECADVIQAICNLVYAVMREQGDLEEEEHGDAFFDMYHQHDCTMRNERRGRY